MKKQQNSKNNASYKQSSATKRVGVMILVSFFLLLLATNVSAFEFDNVKSYGPITREVTITNMFGLGRDIGKGRLNTPPIMRNLPTIYQKVAEFEVLAYQDYDDIIKSIEFYDKNEVEWEKHKFERDFDLKYKTFENVKVDDRKLVCEKVWDVTNQTYSDFCEHVIIGSHYEEQIVWKEFTSASLEKDEVMIVGIFTNVLANDHVEWIPQLFGLKITEWGEWIAGEVRTSVAGDDIDNPDGVYNYKYGIVGNFTDTNVTIINITKGAGATANVSYVQTAYDSGIVATANFTGNTATFDPPINLVGGVGYYFLLDNNGSNHNFVRNTASELPRTDNEFIWYASKGGAGLEYNHIKGIQSISYQVWGYVSPPLITLNSPLVDANYTSPQSITFNYTASDGEELVDVKFYINAGLNQINASGLNNTDYLFNVELGEGDYTIYAKATDNESSETDSDSIRIVIDGTAPLTNITYPINGATYTDNYSTEDNVTIQLNWTTTDTHLDSCWYYNTTANVSLTCGDNATIYLPYGTYTFYVYANDTFGNLNVEEVTATWDYKIFENLKVYNLSSFETETETFYMNVTIDGATLTNAELIYNGTIYSATATSTSGNDYNVSRTIDIPIVIGDKSFFFNLTVDGIEISSPTLTQLINLTSFAHCVAGTPFINISFKNETISEEDVTAAISSTWNYWLGSGTVIKALSFSNVSENPSYAFCLAGIDRTLEANVSLIYSNSISQQRNFVDSFSLTNVTTNKTLYLLPTIEGVFITFQVISVAEQPIPGVSTDVFKTGTLITNGVTDDAGTVSFFLDPDSSYTFIFSKTGYEDYTTTLTPTQTTFTITLGGEEVVEEDDYTRGITYSISPGAVSLVNDTNTYFNFTLTSTYWDVEEFGFNLTNQDGVLLDSTSASTNGGTVFILQNTSNYTTITMTFFWTIEGNESVSSVFWAVVDSSGTGFGVTTFFTHLEEYLDTEMFGLNSNSLVILVYIIIFIVTGIMSFKYGISSPATISVMIFGLVFLFEAHLGWVAPVSGIPVLTILFALVSIALIYREGLR